MIIQFDKGIKNYETFSHIFGDILINTSIFDKNTRAFHPIFAKFGLLTLYSWFTHLRKFANMSRMNHDYGIRLVYSRNAEIR